jgi:2-(1,2-epoxy-1,2-dihydrophenyl)acetyl-CoA isomerase
MGDASQPAAVTVERQEDSVARVSLGGGHPKNPLTPEMKEELPAVFDQLGGDPTVRAIVLTGQGEAFCAGADVQRLMPDPDAISAYGMRRTVQDANRLSRALYHCEKPVVAAVNGDAVGAGMVIALLADIVLAARRARFGAGFVYFSLIPDVGGTYLLPRILGMPRAKELLFTGRLIDAAEAERIGLVSRVMDDDRLQIEAMDVARRLAQMPTACLGLLKRLLDANLNSTYEEALDREAMAQAWASTLDDFREGYRAFHEKRRPSFGGSLLETRAAAAGGVKSGE